MKGKMAIIGDGDSVLVFSSIGVDAYPVQNSENAENVLKKIASKYQIIFITDDVAKQINETISRYITSPYPIILPIPSKNGSNGYGTSTLEVAMEKALGVNIFANQNKDEEDN